MAHRWYSIQTYAGSERSVKAAIENIIAENHLEDVITVTFRPKTSMLKTVKRKFLSVLCTRVTCSRTWI